MQFRELKKYFSHDPRHISKFRMGLKEIVWNEDPVSMSITELFNELDLLVEAEIRYYYRRSKRRAFWSIILRVGMIVCASIGTIIPLMEKPIPLFLASNSYSFFSGNGYAFLAAAAAFYSANQLFGGTTGHVRFTEAHLKLEKLATSSRIKWYKYLGCSKSGDKPENNIRTGFYLINHYAEELYKISLTVTTDWGEHRLSELAKYQETLSHNKG
ncbi:SLATT domain-containing protein [Maridesulfovibrio frigidus]|uniref:SLATT domain-containing protein n=1 Tax=Maridesulfovibrio frigidus TaxID=340956 RepID=UPI0004E10043|nr:SLATT domain-containing protein [Maridesulfovibrio frigidus]